MLLWNEIKFLKASAARGGIVGWQIVTESGEKYAILPPSPKRFIDYVKAIQPGIEVWPH